MLKGKLTYILATAAIVWGLAGITLGWSDNQTGLNAIWLGLTAFGLRRAIN